MQYDKFYKTKLTDTEICKINEYIKKKNSPPSGIGDLSRFWRSYLDPLVYLLAKLFKLFGFPTFRF
jgi:hypothetical protein